MPTSHLLHLRLNRLARRVVKLVYRPIRRYQDWHQRRWVWQRTRGTVFSGPFAGLKLTRDVTWGNPSPILLGTYEAEVAGAIEQAIACEPRLVIDIGCAEGYYAVGLASRIPQGIVHAFDIDPRAREVCRVNAERNNVGDRVVVDGCCTVELLRGLAGEDAFLVVDCEGCETELLDPIKVPALRMTLMLVEMHDFLDSSTSATIISRFRDSHDITVYSSKARNEHHELLRRLSRRQRYMALDEHRPTKPHPMQWAFLKPRSVREPQRGEAH